MNEENHEFTVSHLNLDEYAPTSDTEVWDVWMLHLWFSQLVHWVGCMDYIFPSRDSKEETLPKVQSYMWSCYLIVQIGFQLRWLVLLIFPCRILFLKTSRASPALNPHSPRSPAITTCFLDPRITQKSRPWFRLTYSSRFWMCRHSTWRFHRLCRDPNTWCSTIFICRRGGAALRWLHLARPTGS